MIFYLCGYAVRANGRREARRKFMLAGFGPHVTRHVLPIDYSEHCNRFGGIAWLPNWRRKRR